MTLPSVAIIIPTRNRPELLKRCLSRLVPYVGVHHECSITVSDDGNASETKEALAGEMRVQVVQGPRRGPAANRNYGAAHSTGEIIVFLDDDCIPDPDLIAAYQDAAYKNPDVGVFEGRISATSGITGFADMVLINETGGYLWSCNFAIRRELFASIGGFDERFPFAAVEDVEFHFRVKKRSAVPFLPNARVWHDTERRRGWRIVQHRALCDVLYLHLHGSRATGRTSGFYIKHLARGLVLRGWKHLRAGATKDPMQLILESVSQLQLVLITLAWRFHPALARMFYPSCCPGCESIHANLTTHNSPSPALQGEKDAT